MRAGGPRTAQAGAVRAAGGAVVDLGAETGAVFRADAGTLCHDGFHPSADGYRVWAHALLPAVSAAADGGPPRVSRLAVGRRLPGRLG